MTGSVNDALEATLLLTVKNFNGKAEQVTFVVDTGFSEYLTLPDEVIASLGLLVGGYDTIALADGTETVVPYYSVVLVWDGIDLLTQVQGKASGPLIGVGLLQNRRLTADFFAGGAVTVAAIY